jgi:signal peptidase II
LTRKSTIILLTASAVYFLDRLTKLAVVENFRLNQSMPVIVGYFDITHVHNTGAAFGLFSLAQDTFRVPFLLASTLAAIAVLIVFVRKTRPDEVLMQIAFALVIGGAVGNLTDRLLYGYVIDFIDWHVGDYYHWPAFNIADSGISVGIFLIAVEVFIRGKFIKSG